MSECESALSALECCPSQLLMAFHLNKNGRGRAENISALEKDIHRLIQHLAELLTAPYSLEQTCRALDLLGQFGPLARAMVEWIEPLLEHFDRRVRRRAAEALSGITYGDPALCEWRKKCGSAGDPVIRDFVKKREERVTS